MDTRRFGSNAHADAMREQFSDHFIIETFVRERQADDFKQLNTLLERLSPGTTRRFTPDTIRTLDRYRGVLLVCRSSDERIVGMVVLTSFSDGTQLIGTIENLCVDEAFRGHHLGRRLMKQAITESRERGHAVLQLTSKPHRRQANVLYESLGFVNIETNVYRRILSD